MGQGEKCMLRASGEGCFRSIFLERKSLPAEPKKANSSIIIFFLKNYFEANCKTLARQWVVESGRGRKPYGIPGYWTLVSLTGLWARAQWSGRAQDPLPTHFIKKDTKNPHFQTLPEGRKKRVKTFGNLWLGLDILGGQQMDSISSLEPRHIKKKLD